MLGSLSSTYLRIIDGRTKKVKRTEVYDMSTGRLKRLSRFPERSNGCKNLEVPLTLPPPPPPPSPSPPSSDPVDIVLDKVKSTLFD
jgi:hypothetical protein